MPSKRKLERTIEEAPVPQGSQKFYCCRCGTAYSRQKGYFPVSHSPVYRGTGYLPVCSECVDEMYEIYRRKLGDDRRAMKRMCMKLDLYWHDDIYNMVEKSAGVMSRVRQYITKTNFVRYIDKTYDDTIDEEERLEAERNWSWQQDREKDDPDAGDQAEVPKDILLFWGPGYTPKMYQELEDRKSYWLSKYPDNTKLSIGEEALLRQICTMEIQINQDRAAGKPIDRSVKTLSGLVGDMSLRPDQQSSSIDASVEQTPFGVWIERWERKRPIPDADPELQDVDHIVKYISTWFLGHLCKMLGIKNTYCKLYEEEMERLRVERPQYADDDDETMFNDIFSSDAQGGGA